MITSGTTNDNEWYNEWQQVTKSDNKWQPVTTNDNEWQQVIKRGTVSKIGTVYFKEWMIPILSVTKIDTLLQGQFPPEENAPRLGFVFRSRLGLVLGLGDNQTIVLEENCPLVRVRIWVRVPSHYKTSSRHLTLVLELSCPDKTFLRCLKHISN